MSTDSSVRRFENRAGAYAAGRPAYPPALVDRVLTQLGLAAGDAVADIGSGTGIFTRQLLDRGLRVTAVEPGDDMRKAAEAALGSHANFRSIAGNARATGLADAGVAAVFAAQAFHWFNEPATLTEWRRIVRPGGSAALIWNYHDETDLFVADYLVLVESFGPEARATMQRAWNTHLDNVFFPPGTAAFLRETHVQRLDFAALLNRAASTSYLPRPDDSRFGDFTARLRHVFDRHGKDGHVDLAYVAIAVCGRLA